MSTHSRTSGIQKGWSARVILVAGPQRVGQMLPLSDARVTTIGRNDDCTLCLPSMRISPVHVRLRADGLAWRIEAGRTSGGQVALLLVNDARCTEASLEAGDRFDIGGFRFRLEDDLTPSDAARSDGMLRLKVVHGPSAPDSTFCARCGEDFLIGHSKTALWLLPDATASRHHCRIEWEASGWLVRDLNSTNGTYLNGERIDRAPLAHLDRLRIGRYDVQVEIL